MPIIYPKEIASANSPTINYTKLYHEYLSRQATSRRKAPARSENVLLLTTTHQKNRGFTRGLNVPKKSASAKQDEARGDAAYSRM